MNISKKILIKLLGVFSDDLGIDLGTSNTLICVKNKGIILDEPSVVAIQTRSKEIFEVGGRAKNMIGRTPLAYETIRPLKNGVIADYEITEKMLNAFYKRVNTNKIFNSPRVVICVPAGITQVEKRAVIEVTRDAGAREAYLIEEPMAAAIGMGINIFEPVGNMIVDIGGGTTEIAVISLGGVVKKSSFKVAGDRFDDIIIDYLIKKHNLLIGGKTSEDIKKLIGNVVDTEETETIISVSGRNTLNGLPKDVELSSTELVESFEILIDEIIEEIKVIFEDTPPELSSDIRRNGIHITGGGSNIKGIAEKLEKSLNLKIIKTDTPLLSVINGIDVLLRNFEIYKKVLISTETDY